MEGKTICHIEESLLFVEAFYPEELNVLMDLRSSSGSLNEEKSLRFLNCVYNLKKNYEITLF